ncbi:hypothetical protein PQX77_004504 [Marasmius sp. AFHP31]|nr:hypothetical protein PQX77_004504 [Marasmius sp. AFHP31]
MEYFGSSLKSIRGNLKTEIQKRRSFLQPNKFHRPPLPHDIVVLIADLLDDRSLRQCALATRSFVSPARARTFKTITLQKGDFRQQDRPISHLDRFTRVRHNQPRQLTKSECLLALLESAPELAELVKEFVIEGQPFTGRSWNTEDHLPLHQILFRLSNLESISLLFQQDNALPLYHFSETSCVAIVQAMHSSKIRRVAVENIFFDNTDTLLAFLRHALAGGGVEELSIAVREEQPVGAPSSVNEVLKNRWKDVPICPDMVPSPTNRLRRLRVNGAPRIVWQVLEWAKRKDSYLSLDSVLCFEALGAITRSQPGLAQVASIALQSQHLRHLGITGDNIRDEEAFDINPEVAPTSSSSSASSSIPPNPLTQALISGLATNLRSITFHAVSPDTPSYLYMPTLSTSLTWWTTLFTQASLPLLDEFRIDRRGFCSQFMLCHHPSVYGLGSELTRCFHVPPEAFRKLERALCHSTPTAMLVIDVKTKGAGEYPSLNRWKEMYFPSDSWSFLEECFPLVHAEGETLGFKFQLRAEVVLSLPRSARAIPADALLVESLLTEKPMEYFGSSFKSIGYNLKAEMRRGQSFFQFRFRKAPGPPLPHEIIILITDLLDDRSLRQCALAVRCFLSPARARTFGTITFQKEEYQQGRSIPHLDRLTSRVRPNQPRRLTKSERLLALIESTPDLAEFAKEFVIEGRPFTGPLWTAEDHLPLHQILPRLPNLESVSLLFHQDHPVSFFYFSETSCMAIAQALHSPQIRRVAIENVSFDTTDTLFVFLRHAVAGGGVEELSITTWRDQPLSPLSFDPEKKLKGWLKETLTPSDSTTSTNRLRSLHVNGPPRVVEQVLEWAKSEQPHICLDSLVRFEVVGAITNAQLNLVGQITSTALQSQHLRHLGIIAGEEAFYPNNKTAFAPSSSSSPTSAPPNPLTRSLLSGIATNLRYITFYAVSFDTYNTTTYFPSLSVSLTWWSTLFAQTSLPTLNEFRIDRRGFCPVFMLCRQESLRGHGDGLIRRFHIPSEVYRNLERALHLCAPTAKLFIDVKARGAGDYPGLNQWKEMFFPSDGWLFLEECFPLAHTEGETLELIFRLRAEVVVLLRRSAHAKPVRVRESGCFVYTPAQRWIRLGDEDRAYMRDVNAPRTDFPFHAG